jgi:hypothetical protein
MRIELPIDYKVLARLFGLDWSRRKRRIKLYNLDVHVGSLQPRTLSEREAAKENQTDSK